MASLRDFSVSHYGYAAALRESVLGRLGTEWALVSEPETLANPTGAECGSPPLPGERWSLRFADLGEVT